MEPIVVTATRTLQPASEVLSSVEVISREELERLPAADVADGGGGSLPLYLAA